MNGTWHFVDASGRVTGATFSGPEQALKANTPAGCAAVNGLSMLHRPDDPDLQRARVITRMAELERSQARPLRELAVDPNNADARRRIEEIDSQIAKLRREL